MHGGFDGDGLAVSGGAVEDYAPLPGDAETVVGVAGVVKAGDGGDEVFFEGRVEDDVVPGGGHDGGVEGRVFGPVALVEDPDFIVEGVGPAAAGEEEVAEQAGGGGGVDDVEVAGVVGLGAVAAVDEVDEELLGFVGQEEGFVEGFGGE